MLRTDDIQCSDRRQRSTRPFTPRLAPLALSLMFALVVALSGCTPSATTSGGHSAATPSPTATPTPRVLYQADWVHHASEWTLPPEWSVVNGVLRNDGNTSNVVNLTIPYTVTVPNYTVTVEMRALAAKGAGVSDEYGFVGQTPAGQTLYTAAMTQVQRSLHSYANVYPAKPDPDHGLTYGTSDFTPGINLRPYMMQVEGTYLTFTAGNGQIGQVKSVDKLSPAKVVIQSQSMELEIESVTITTP